jgi:hypothetical protein
MWLYRVIDSDVFYRDWHRDKTRESRFVKSDEQG